MYDLLLIAVIAFITLLTRVIPFLFFKNKNSPIIQYLGDVLPFAIMAMLVVYCLKDVDFLDGYHGICEVLSVVSVIVLHLWKRNTLLSIFGGTIVYMICVQVLFI